ncbi:MAG: adenylyltransferase/cytidyltransferase family protein [Bacteroidia bacterium]
MLQKIAVFPGSFDPITRGHENIVRRGLPLFDKIIIGIGHNTNKNYFFSQERREHFIKKTFEGESKIEVMRYSGLTVEFCKEIGATISSATPYFGRLRIRTGNCANESLDGSRC